MRRTNAKAMQTSPHTPIGPDHPRIVPRIVVLDGYALNPGDLGWDKLREVGECTIYDRTPPGDLPARAGDADCLLTNKTILDADSIRSLPRLRYIGVLATGYNVVDTNAARERGIIVTNVPAYGTASVAQATFALLLELTNRVGHHSQTVHAGRWSQSRDYCYWDYPLLELAGRVMGIIGLGTIGRQVAQIAQAFGMRVIAHTRSATETSIETVPLDRLISQSDVVSLHCPLTEQTRGIINRQRLGQMKRTAFLINTSRGPLIDEQALADALKSEQIAGAGLDVLSTEPPSPQNPLLGAKNCIITPHIAWATQAARQRLMETAVSNLQAFLQGRAQNVVG
jgi:glycerate dehydrogenase